MEGDRSAKGALQTYVSLTMQLLKAVGGRTFYLQCCSQITDQAIYQYMPKVINTWGQSVP